MYHEQTPPDKDPRLWDLARRRASFRRHLATYLVIIGFLWVLWFIIGAGDNERRGVPWPVWAMLGWGIGLFFHYLGAYGKNGTSTIEKEYEKLQNNQKQ
jgi:hypothetical protein